MILLYEPGQRMYKLIVGFLCEFSLLILIAALNGNGILISCRHRVGLFLKRNTLYQLSVISNDKVSAGRPFMGLGQIGKITAVLFARSYPDSPYNAQKYFSLSQGRFPVWNNR